MSNDKKAFDTPCVICGGYHCEHRARPQSQNQHSAGLSVDDIKSIVQMYVEGMLSGLDNKIKVIIEQCEEGRKGQISDLVKLCVAELNIESQIQTLADQIESLSSSALDSDKVKLIAKDAAAECFSILIVNYCTENKIDDKIALALEGFDNFSQEQIEGFVKDKFDELFGQIDLKQQIQECINNTDFSDEFKSVAFDCIKDFLQEIYDNASSGPGPDGNTTVVGSQLSCNQSGMLTSSVFSSDGSISQATEDLSKFIGPSRNIITDLDGDCDEFGNLRIGLGQSAANYLDVNLNLSKFFDAMPLNFGVCFDYGGPTYPVIDGKVTLRDSLKCERWNGGYDHVSYSQADDCRVIRYKGPTQADIESIALQVYNGLPSQSGLTLQEVKACIQSVNNTLCVTDVDMGLDSDTGELSIAITDQCGTKRASAFIPLDPTGNNGITEQQAKIIAQNCINDTVKAIVLQCIADNVDVPTTQDIENIVQNWFNSNPNQFNNLIQSWFNANQDDFCNLSVGLNFDQATRELTFTVTDQCGALSASQVIPDITGVSEQEATTIAKQQAQICINDPANDSRFCNSSLQLSLTSAGMLQATVTDGCGSRSDNQDLSAYVQSLIPDVLSYCLSNLQLNYSGSTLSVSVDQENCTNTLLGQVNLPIDGNGNTVECCNTSATFGFNGQTCVGTITINQSAGDAVPVDIPFADIFSVQDTSENCHKKQALMMGNKTLLEVPLAVVEPQVVRVFEGNADIDLNCLNDCQYYYRCDNDTFYCFSNGLQVPIAQSAEPRIAMFIGWLNPRLFACKYAGFGRVYCGNYTQTYKHDENTAKLCVCASSATSGVNLTLPSGSDYEIDWGIGAGYVTAQSGVEATNNYPAEWCGTITIRLPLCEDNENIVTRLSGLEASPSFCGC